MGNPWSTPKIDGLYKNKKAIFITAFLFFALIFIFFLSLCCGRYEIPLKDIFNFVLNQNINPMSERIILYLRIPRTLLSTLIGIALALSGTIYQSIFNNKLVSPDLLGVSSGASVGACIAILLDMSDFVTTSFAFISGCLTVITTRLISKIFKNSSNIILLLSGIAMGGLMSSLVGLLKYLADDEMKLSEMTYWLLGDISKATYKDVISIGPIIIICVAISVFLSWQLNILSLGHKESISLGINYNFLMNIFIIIATLLTACAVAVSGVISWVGLVIPNIVRLFLGNDNKIVVPISILSGAIYMMIVDIFARSLAPNEIPLSVITGIAGTPIFLFALFRQQAQI
ncbi:MAG: iron ABC transporter permease [Spirochaetaceae bacterium]|nr:iron ABC transporter permease [Spirochaetaceae bacterium]